jgi:hypothetical protein
MRHLWGWGVVGLALAALPAWAGAWDPATGAVEELPHAGHTLFCAGYTFLPDGRLRPAPPPPPLGFTYGSAWKYHDGGVDLGTAWLDVRYDDSLWKSGPAPLARGASAARPTRYFRKTLHLDTPVTAATLQALYADGIAIWVNGTLVLARNMGQGTAHAAFASASTTSGGRVRAALSLSPNPFVPGDNVIAVMVKQAADASTDAPFDLELQLSSAP